MTEAEFAEILESIRPKLVTNVARYRCVSQDEAEDVIAEAVRYALQILPNFVRDETREIAVQLTGWMLGLAKFIVLERRRRASLRPQTVNIDAVGEIAEDYSAQNNPPHLDREVLLQQLPWHQRALVEDWLAGRTQRQIALDHGLHPNTVGNRLKLAFETLREACPDADDLIYSDTLLRTLSQVSVYYRPAGRAHVWARRHPADVLFTVEDDGRVRITKKW